MLATGLFPRHRLTGKPAHRLTMKRKHPWRNALITAGFLGAVAAVVVYSSFQVSDYECEVCMTFGGGDVCRTVTGKTEEEGMRTGIDNACAQLSSGVTETLRCQRTMPRKAECRRLEGG